MFLAGRYLGHSSGDKEFRDCISEYLGKPYGGLIKRLHGISYFSDYTLSIETKNTYRAVYGVDSLCDPVLASTSSNP